MDTEWANTLELEVWSCRIILGNNEPHKLQRQRSKANQQANVINMIKCNSRGRQDPHPPKKPMVLGFYLSYWYTTTEQEAAFIISYKKVLGLQKVICQSLKGISMLFTFLLFKMPFIFDCNLVQVQKNPVQRFPFSSALHMWVNQVSCSRQNGIVGLH